MHDAVEASGLSEVEVQSLWSSNSRRIAPNGMPVRPIHDAATDRFHSQKIIPNPLPRRTID
jgi:hypothetical protein